MRRISLMIVVSLLSFCTYGQLALEGFEAQWTGSPAAPPGWVVYNETGNVTWARTSISTTPPYAGNYAAYLDRENVAPSAPIPTNWLITPQFNGPVNGELHFYSRLISLGDQGSIFKIKIAAVTDPSVPVQNLQWTDLVAPMGELEMNPQQQQYTEKNFSIPAAYSGQQIRIALIMQDDYGDRWLVDNLEVVSHCTPPTALTVTNLTATSADLNWNNPAGVSSWEIELLSDTQQTTGTGIIYSGALPYHATGLLEDTKYKYFVRSICPDGGKSTWSGPFYFNTTLTGSLCGNPIVIPSSLPYTNNNNTAPYGDHYEGTPGTGCNVTGSYLAGNDVIYSYTPTASGNINISLLNTFGTTGLFVYNSCGTIGVNCIGGVTAAAGAVGVIPTLSVTANTTYYIVVSTNGTPQTTPYTLVLQQANCAAPTGLTASGQTPVSANLSWAVGTATSWQVAIQTAGTGLPSGAGSNQTSNTITATQTTNNVPFTQATTYEYYVRANCGNGTFSAWTGPFMFSTTQIPSNLGDDETFDEQPPYAFTIINGTQTNRWTVGSAVSSSPSNSLYITNDNGATNAYSEVTSIVHAYRDVVIPPGASEININFDFKCRGESSASGTIFYDYLTVWLVPTSFNPIAGTAISPASDRIKIAELNNKPSWTPISLDTPVSAFQNSTRRLLFEWKNNGAATIQPPAAVDNLVISLGTCSKPTGLTAINITNTNATLDWTEPGTATNWEIKIMPSAEAATPLTAGTPVSTQSEYTPPAGTLTPGIQYVYYVRSICGGTNGNSNWAGPYIFALKPSNDECANAITVPVNPTLNCSAFALGNITGATGSAEITSCNGGKDDDIWFEFTATNTSHIINLSNIAGSTPSLFYALYTGSNCAAMTQVTPCGTTNSQTFSNLTVGQVYKIRIWTLVTTANQNTTFQLCITTPPAPPANDICSQATIVPVNPTLTCSATVPGTIYSATASTQVLSPCTGVADDDVWFKFIATNNTHSINITNITGGTSLLYHSVYTGADCSTFTLNYCSILNQSWANNLSIGQTYYIRVYSATGTTGQTSSFNVCVGTPPAPPVNDECSGAIVAVVNPSMVCEEVTDGTITSATASPEANTCANTNDDDDVWFEFVATNTNHTIEFKNVTGTSVSDLVGPDLYHAVYSGNICSTLTQLYCSDPDNSVATNLTIGQTYKIRVWTATANTNQSVNFQLCIGTPPPPPVNDECANAIVVPVNTDASCTLTASGSIFGATASPEGNTCTNSNDDDDVWFEFTATNTKHLISIIDVSGTTAKLDHVVYAGNQCGSLTQLYCSNPTGNLNSSTNYSVANNLIPGNVYKIRVYSNTASPNQSTQFNICIKVPNTPATVDTNTYTPEQLVTDVLINSECATVSNISSITGSQYGDVNGIGYFNTNGATFPFSYGVVLSTGAAQLAQGPYITAQNDTANTTKWPGDSDLNSIIVANNPTMTAGTYNATILEFDFIPLTNKFSFDYLFASNEYGPQFQCGYTDAFAFILTDQNGNDQNLAVVPNTNIPVSVTTIRDGQFNSGCGSNNVEYFGQYNEAEPLAAAINYRGQTKPMTAQADVIPGESYHIKLVIADYRDAALNAAIFLGGGTFNIGNIDMGDDLLVSNGKAICDGGTTTLDTGLVGGQYNFIWYKDGVLIPDASASTYVVSEPGSYGVEAKLDNAPCSFEGVAVVEFYPDVNDLTGNPEDLMECSTTGFSAFDLTSNIDIINGGLTDPQNYTTTVYLSEDDAQNEVNPIDTANYMAYSNTVEDLQTLWVKTVNNATACMGIKSFDLIVKSPPQYTITGDLSMCDGTTSSIDVVITDTDPNPVTYTWTKDGAPLPDTTPSITVTEAGAYTVVLDREGCTATSTVNVSVNPTPVADAPADVTVCESYTLPALSANNTYYDAATNAVVAPGTVISVTTIFNVVASSGTIPECTSQNTFTVTVNNAPILAEIADVAACDIYILPALTVGNYYTETGGPSGTGTLLNADDEITSSQTIYVYAETGTTPNCTSEVSFEVTINISPVADAPADVEACDSYVLPALSAGNTYWTGSNGTGEQLPVGYVVEEPMLVFVYAQTATNPVCTNENSFNVTITPTPSFSIGEDRIACVPSNVIITITDTNFTDANNPSYSWTVDGTPVSGGSSITASVFGTYEVTVTVGNCSHSESIEVEENNTPVELIIADGCENGVYMIEVSPENDSFDTETASYSWTGPGTFVSDKREFAATAIGEYFVTVTTAEGCIGEDSIVVSSTSCTIQKGISPNNDNLNDSFDLSELMVKHLSIFNRYGEEVYSKDNYKNEWVGQTNSGKELPTGTYFYMIELTGGESKTGWIYINRQD